MDFALSSVRRTASAVEMSGLGAPFLTASARRSVAITVALFGSMFPVLSASGNGANNSETSRAWPFATVFRVLTPVPYVILTCAPVLASKSPTNFSSVALIGSGDSRVISLWALALDGMLSPIMATTSNESGVFKARSSNIPAFRVPPSVLCTNFRQPTAGPTRVRVTIFILAWIRTGMIPPQSVEPRNWPGVSERPKRGPSITTSFHSVRPPRAPGCAELRHRPETSACRRAARLCPFSMGLRSIN